MFIKSGSSSKIGETEYTTKFKFYSVTKDVVTHCISPRADVGLQDAKIEVLVYKTLPGRKLSFVFQTLCNCKTLNSTLAGQIEQSVSLCDRFMSSRMASAVRGRERSPTEDSKCKENVCTPHSFYVSIVYGV